MQQTNTIGWLCPKCHYTHVLIDGALCNYCESIHNKQTKAEGCTPQAIRHTGVKHEANSVKHSKTTER